MSSIFWGLRLEAGKRYSTIVDNSFHVSKAALDCSSVKNDSEIVSVMLEEGESRTSFILCNLQRAKELQSNLDLNFMSGDQVTFFCKGNGVVHLSGYIIFEDDDGLVGGLGEEEEEGEDEENGEADVDVMNQFNGITQKRKMGRGSKQESKKIKLEEAEDSDEDEDDDDEDDELTMDENLSDLAGSDDDEDDDEEVDSDESEEGEDEGDEEEESEEEDEVPAKQVQLNQKQKNKGKGQQNQLSSPGSKQSSPAGDKQKTPKGQQKPPNQQQSGKKDKKKGDTPKQLDKSASEDTPQKLKPTIVQGGVIIKDLKLGNGPACKNGKMVTVYYTGRLKSNNKVFDSTTQGSGFMFRLGKGEVIKGWDVGLQGMKVGGKRMITCPPPMAYGQKGSPPTIPGNSTLTFEVELRSVN